MPTRGHTSAAQVDKLASVCEFAKLIRGKAGESRGRTGVGAGALGRRALPALPGPGAHAHRVARVRAQRTARTGPVGPAGASAAWPLLHHAPPTAAPSPLLRAPPPRPPDSSSASASSSAADSAALLRDLAPSFVWLLRDFQFQLTEDGRQVGACACVKKAKRKPAQTTPEFLTDTHQFTERRATVVTQVVILTRDKPGPHGRPFGLTPRCTCMRQCSVPWAR